MPIIRYRVLLHILFWIAMVFYEVFIWGMLDNSYQEKLTTSLLELPVKLTATYFTLYFLIDRFLIAKKYTTFLILLVLSMAFFGVVLRILNYQFIYPVYYPLGLTAPMLFAPKILISVFVIYSLVAIVASFHLMRHYYNHQQAAQQLQKQTLAAELKLLKSQINPHFLFNTLNNLYVLTLNNSGKAPDVVHKLSQLMSYMLYDSNQPEVPLEMEIQYIKNYIDLEKVRYGERLEVLLRVYEKTEGIKVAPLLILPLVENSFKHGASHQLDSGWIHIDIEVQEKMLLIKVENSKPQFNGEHRITSGIGLDNARKRLNHLYPGRHSLQLFDEPDAYLAVLKIRVE
ncbi:MAG TPA: histidine kinase [Cyclobacteriaceae bacterium]|nr:histidine kinase [Cyclobacteriaceae bacterium]